MTLSDALKTNRCIRNPEFGAFKDYDNPATSYTKAQIMSDKWEVEPVTVSITLEALTEAWITVMSEPNKDAMVILENLAKALGL